MQTEIPNDILEIISRCKSDASSVTWTDVDRVAEFFRSFGHPGLANKMLQIQSDVAGGKYDVLLDRDDVTQLTLFCDDRALYFPYRHGENVDDVVARLIKKHNLAEGHPEGSQKYNEVHLRVKKAVAQTAAKFRAPHSEDHLDRPKTPGESDRSHSTIRPVTPEMDDGRSAREVQESLAQMRKKKVSKSNNTGSNSRSPSKSNSSILRPTRPPNDEPHRPSSPPKEKFKLKPPKRISQRSPQKRSNIGTVASLSKSDNKTTSLGEMRGPVPQIAPSFGRSSVANSRGRKRARREVEVRARDIVRMVSDQGYDDMRTRLRQLGMKSRELSIVNERLDMWKAFVAEELLYGSRTAPRRSRERQLGRAVPHYMIEDEDEVDHLGLHGPFDEENYFDDTREEIDDELDSYFVNGTPVWARTPNQKYFRRGRVMDTFVGNNNVRVRFDDGRPPNNKYFHVEYSSTSIRRSKPPLDLIHIDSDDFIFTYTTEQAVDSSSSNSGRSDIDAQKEMVNALTKLTSIYAEMERKRTMENEEDRRGKRKNYGQRTEQKSVFSSDFSFGGGSFGDDGHDIVDDAKAPIEFHLDENVEQIAVRIRLKTNKVVNAKFNITHTVGDVRNFLDLNHPLSGSYKLMLGFPPKELDDNSQNVVDAQLKNSQILQR